MLASRMLKGKYLRCWHCSEKTQRKQICLLKVLSSERSRNPGRLSQARSQYSVTTERSYQIRVTMDTLRRKEGCKGLASQMAEKDATWQTGHRQLMTVMQLQYPVKVAWLHSPRRPDAPGLYRAGLWAQSCFLSNGGSTKLGVLVVVTKHSLLTEVGVGKIFLQMMGASYKGLETPDSIMLYISHA